MFGGNLLGHPQLDFLVDRGKYVHAHQGGDHQVGLDVQLVGKFPNHNGLPVLQQDYLPVRIGGRSLRFGGRTLAKRLFDRQHLFVGERGHVRADVRLQHIPELVQNVLAGEFQFLG